MWHVTSFFGIGATVCTGQEIQGYQYAVFLLLKKSAFAEDIK